jgi:hypothetical protein
LKADPRFLTQTKEFWANVRTISQEVGYTNRGNKRTEALPSVKIPTIKEVRQQFKKLDLKTTSIENENGALTDFGQHLFDYFTFRATVLNDIVQGHFMKKDSAEIEFKGYVTVKY